MTKKLFSADELRSKHRSARAMLSQDQLIANGSALVEQVTRLAEFVSARHVASYIAIRGEMDTKPVLQQSADKDFYLPVIRDAAMQFVSWKPGDTLLKKGFGLLEPDCDEQHVIEPPQLDLVLVPLVVFDSHCNRIGQGGGYYDRAFEFLRGRTAANRPVLMGVAHESQREPTLLPQEWDVPLDFVVTESSVYRRGEISSL